MPPRLSSSPQVVVSLSRRKGSVHHPIGGLEALAIPRTREVRRRGPPMLVRDVHCRPATSAFGSPRPRGAARHRGAARPAPEPPGPPRAVVGRRLLGWLHGGSGPVGGAAAVRSRP